MGAIVRHRHKVKYEYNDALCLVCFSVKGEPCYQMRGKQRTKHVLRKTHTSMKRSNDSKV